MNSLFKGECFIPVINQPINLIITDNEAHNKMGRENYTLIYSQSRDFKTFDPTR